MGGAYRGVVVTIVHAGPDDAELVLGAADLFDQPPVPEHTAPGPEASVVFELGCD